MVLPYNPTSLLPLPTLMTTRKELYNPSKPLTLPSQSAVARRPVPTEMPATIPTTLRGRTMRRRRRIWRTL
jgi:hypothetical protein